MSPTFNGSSLIQHFEGNDAIEIDEGITFDFYTGLPHVVSMVFPFALQADHVMLKVCPFTLAYLQHIHVHYKQHSGKDALRTLDLVWS